MSTLQFLVEFLVGLCVVFSRIFQDRQALALSVCQQLRISVLLSLDYSVAIVDSQFAELHEVEVVLVCAEAVNGDVLKLKTVLEVVADVL